MMRISNENWKKICENADGLYWDIDRMSQDGKYFLNKLTKTLKEVEKENKEDNDKIYVVVNNAIVDDEICYSVGGATLSKKESKEIFNEVVRNVKIDADFDNLDALDLDNEENNTNEDRWYYSESEDSFELYLNGEYNSNNFSVKIVSFDINNEKKKDMEL